MTITDTIDNIKLFLTGRIESLAMTNPMISFIKPIMLRIVNNNMYKLNKTLSLIADESGNIDVNSLIPEIIQSVSNTTPFILHTEVLGDIELGGGSIKIGIPFTSNQVVLGKADLDVLQELFKNKQ